ncbi:Protein mak11 [Elasticomyces elasticus]|uniref:Protein mak11 n=1 Tax=Exophiala sideris TaxID=1016849 RepID=A0ABR0J7G6_9EURO|nr:Protein mak11 [Elasticomyces elasticus]KAK5029565.1 Protein mak11 [Exophiala sideris]KAK5036742.1 Protein mak11 [Exophiala sideris]KAK5058194.1 Protein mak11 [Exophiala sideris]KAK5182154.1 Protein mak11 [Eurotiomycetes sp. CCFEE 6388]
MAKRKRDTDPQEKTISTNGVDKSAKLPKTNGHVDVKTISPVIQIIAGSYERVLHGITASISNLSSSKTAPSVKFADSFLFNAHASAVRCLALSPLPEPDSSEAQSVYLATGGSDEKINVYSLSASPVSEHDKTPAMPSLGNNTISENPRNRELGTLLQHSSNITTLHFPTRSKLLAGSEDNTVSVTRVRDLSVVSTIKAPRPKVLGQPSGDTAPPGATPAGINDFAVHPSLKLMVSVGRGERCMRLWNLVTGKKAGVLNFSREVLQSVKESKYSSGEGRRIRWSPDGSGFAVSFERGAVVFGEDSKARCKILPQPLTKLHHISYLSLPDASGNQMTLLAVSTEDGRILFYHTDDISPVPTNDANAKEELIPEASCRAQVGGKTAGISTRVKDFELLFSNDSPEKSESVFIVAASSDGTIRLIHLPLSDLRDAVVKSKKAAELGTVIGTYSTGNRITCMKAFVMLPPSDEDDDLGGEEDEFEGFEEGSDESESDDE